MLGFAHPHPPLSINPQPTTAQLYVEANEKQIEFVLGQICVLKPRKSHQHEEMQQQTQPLTNLNE